MSDFRKYDVELAKAVASAVQADYLRLPELRIAVARGQINAPGLRDLMLRDLELSVRAPGQKPMFPALRRVLKTQMNIEESKLRGGMSQWAELATAIAGAAGGIISAKTTAKTNEDIAKIQLQQQQLAAKAAQAQANMAQLQLAQAQGYPGAAGGLSTPVVAALAAGGVAVTGFLVYLMTRKRGR